MKATSNNRNQEELDSYKKIRLEAPEKYFSKACTREVWKAPKSQKHRNLKSTGEALLESTAG